jgi:aminopeptidase N
MTGYVWDYFAPSVKMSSYLVAFLVSDFINIPAKPGVSNVQFRIWARANAASITSYVFIILRIKMSLLDFNKLFCVNRFKRYAIDIGPRILEYYESYFSIDYPLAKQDMAAIPDFAAGNVDITISQLMGTFDIFIFYCIGAMENWGLITYR